MRQGIRSFGLILWDWVVLGLLACSCGIFFLQTRLAYAQTEKEFIEKLPVYGVIKPQSITTLLAINHGIISKIVAQIGETVSEGAPVIEVLERETNRVYRSSIKGGVVKLHVTTGAAVTPGMPLATIMNPSLKIIEISLSPSEMTQVKVGTRVSLRPDGKVFGRVSRMSSLVDPDTGAVLAFVHPDFPVAEAIGDILPIDLHLRTLTDCNIQPIAALDTLMDEYSVVALSGGTACLRKLPQK